MTEAWFAALGGLLIGSFWNVCIHRLPRDESVTRPRRSYCPHCLSQIAWYDNLPVISFLLLRGKCRRCGGRISLRYPLVELLTGALFYWAVKTGGFSLEAARTAVFGSILLVLFFTDLEEKLLPDEFTLGGVAAGLVFAWLVPLPAGVISLLLPGRPVAIRSFAESLAGALMLGGMLWLVGRLYEKVRGREGLGYGDVKLTACIGAFLGLHEGLLALIGGSLLGSVIGLAYIVVRRKDPATYELPYGSFLAASALMIALFGRRLAEWYIAWAG